MPLRHCAKCNEDKPESAYIRRTERPWLFLAWCRQCRSKDRRNYRDKEYNRLYNAKRRGACAWCWGKRSYKNLGDIQMYLIDNKTALYHSECAKEKAKVKKLELLTYESPPQDSDRRYTPQETAI